MVTDDVYMKKQRGKETEKLGKKLTKYVKKSHSTVQVFYDHGTSKKKNVGRIMPYLRQAEYNRLSTLSGIDIMITRKNRVVILIEIEERGASPKKIIGDILNIFFAKNVRFKGNIDYDIKNTTVLICSKVKTGGLSAKKTEEIRKRIGNMKEKLKDSSFGKGISKIRCICKDNIKDLMDAAFRDITSAIKKDIVDVQ